MKQMRWRMFGVKNHLPSTLSASTMKSGIYNATGFPPSIQYSELVIECVKHCDPQTRMIRSLKGAVHAYLAEESIGEVFAIPRNVDMQEINKDEALVKFEKRVEACMIVVNNEWVLETRRHHYRLPKRLLCSDFKDEYNDSIFFLN